MMHIKAIKFLTITAAVLLGACASEPDCEVDSTLLKTVKDDILGMMDKNKPHHIELLNSLKDMEQYTNSSKPSAERCEHLAKAIGHHRFIERFFSQYVAHIRSQQNDSCPTFKLNDQLLTSDDFKEAKFNANLAIDVADILAKGYEYSGCTYEHEEVFTKVINQEYEKIESYVTFPEKLESLIK